MEKTFMAETGAPDLNGNQVLLSGLELPQNPSPLLANFDVTAPIGLWSDAKITEQGLQVRARYANESLDGYPAIGFQVLESELNERGGVTVTKSRLKSVSICCLPNTDPAIKKLSEQGDHA